MYVSIKVMRDDEFNYLKSLCKNSGCRNLMVSLWKSSAGWPCTWSAKLSGFEKYWVVPNAKYVAMYTAIISVECARCYKASINELYCHGIV